MARGRWGEDQAARWYRDKGYVVLDRNWRCPGGEIDLVVSRRAAAGSETVVFVEVKARSSDRLGAPAAAVDSRKQRKVRRAAMCWLDAHPGQRGALRFDVVAITGVRLEVIEAAY